MSHVPNIVSPKPASPQRSATTSPGRGAAYWLGPLRAGRPDLARQVEAGALTHYQGAVAAGWRKRLSPVEEVQRRVAALSRDEFRQFFGWLMQHARGR
jgi:hypothetical protein